MRIDRKSSVLFVICYLAYSSIYIARLNFSIASPMLEDMGVLDKTQIGIIGSVFFFAYAICKLPNGYIGDRAPAKKMIAYGLIITGITNICIGFMPDFWVIVILWGVNAFGQSMLWGPMLRYITSHFGESMGKITSSYLVSSVAVGSMLGLLVAGWGASAFGVKASFFIPGVIALFMALIVYLVMEEKKLGIENKRKPLSIKSLLMHKEFLRMIVPAMSHGMIKDNINIWLAVYFVDTFAINIRTVSGYVFFVPMMGFLGRMLVPLLYKVFHKDENKVSMLAFVLCILSIIPLCMKNTDPFIAIICLGIISAMISVINTHMLTGFPTKFYNTGNISFMSSTMDILTYGGAGIGSILFGLIIQGLGYNSMFVVWGLISLCSILFLYLSMKQERDTQPDSLLSSEGTEAF